MSAAQIDHRFSEPTTLFFGVGAQKAGTSWLHAYLNQHPEACVPPGKEMHYWSYWQTGLSFHHDVQKKRLAGLREAGEQPPEFLQRSITMRETRDPMHGLYADIVFERFKGQKLVGEITPDYSNLSVDTFAQMAALNADTRFVFLMRDPIERLHSAMRKQLRARDNGDRSRKIGNEEILNELKTMLGRKNSTALRRSRYNLTIANLEAAVAPEKIGYFFYEDMFEKRNVDDICDFLGIARKPGDFDTKVNVGNPREREFDPAFRALALEHVGDVYDLMKARFGDHLPQAWKMHIDGDVDLSKVAENVK
ncbi:sulfotransferase [Pseudophaeobacter flagellatus]|uniref:sulfotransferase n=1 Tax=Pseudophaeobacter flagellatus TaxID=2899119 RepID=UPI001E44F8B5|nr:sulfotransferase [Pseudophaeobacter flagellatus]MCD9146430.1 sulfotransferase [Pseudophaeobacter flagellatus]